MKQQVTAESFRKNEREKSENFSKVVDANYQALHDIARAFVELEMKHGTRIDTAYGSFTFIRDLMSVHEIEP